MTSRSDDTQSARRTAIDPHAQQPPDTKQRVIEHGAEEYYRRETSVAESERAGQPREGGDAEASDSRHRANGDRSL